MLDVSSLDSPRERAQEVEVLRMDQAMIRLSD